MLPPGTREELQYAAQVLSQIDAAASQACPSCRGGLEQIPAALLAAGQLAEPSVTYVSPPLVEDDSLRRGPAARLEGRRRRTGGSTGGDGDSDPLDPPDLPASGDGSTVDDPTGPLDDIVGGLTGQGGEQTSGGGWTAVDGGVVDDTVDAVEDVIDILDDPLLALSRLSRRCCARRPCRAA